MSKEDKMLEELKLGRPSIFVGKEIEGNFIDLE